MFGAEIGQCPVLADEIKRPRCENLACRTCLVLRRFEFGGVF